MHDGKSGSWMETSLEKKSVRSEKMFLINGEAAASEERLQGTVSLSEQMTLMSLNF